MVIHRKKWLLVVNLLIYSPACLFPQDKTPKYSNEFLNLGVGARAMGMGNTQVAITDDVTSGYWNPAGMTGMTRKYEISLMHASYFAGIANYDYIGFATPIDSRWMTYRTHDIYMMPTERLIITIYASLPRPTMPFYFPTHVNSPG
jgi:hypothetical protein